MRIAFLLAWCFSAVCEGRLTGIDHEIYPAVVWQLADGTYLVRVKTDVEESHDFICDNFHHSENCLCLRQQPHLDKEE